MIKAAIEKIEKRIARNERLFWITLAISNLVTGTVAVIITLHLTHTIWHLRP
jgi:hypothetical protein